MRWAWRVAAAAALAPACAFDPGVLHVTPEVFAREDWQTVALTLEGLHPRAALEVRRGRLALVEDARVTFGGAPAAVDAVEGGRLVVRLRERPAVGPQEVALEARGARHVAATPVLVLGPREEPCEERVCGECACGSGCPCAFSCEDGCHVTCRGADAVCEVDARAEDGDVACGTGARCEVEAEGAEGLDLECVNRARCAVRAARSEALSLDCVAGSTCDLDLREAESPDVDCLSRSTCTVDCRGASDCEVRCEGGAACLLDCRGADGCGYASCPAGATACAEDVLACNTACR